MCVCGGGEKEGKGRGWEEKVRKWKWSERRKEVNREGVCVCVGGGGGEKEGKGKGWEEKVRKWKWRERRKEVNRGRVTDQVARGRSTAWRLRIFL